MKDWNAPRSAAACWTARSAVCAGRDGWSGGSGFGRDLLAAISVQNIYANLCRIGRQRGRPRLISQPPDAYLPVLAVVFPGEEERLRRITAAYMRVHYGAHPVSGEELAALREDYRVLARQAAESEPR